jgi:hypothetical protein
MKGFELQVFVCGGLPFANGARGKRVLLCAAEAAGDDE